MRVTDSSWMEVQFSMVMQFGRSLRRRWLTVSVIALLSVVALVSIATRVPFSSEILRSRVTASLRDALDADVEIGTVGLRIFPQFEARVEHLVIRHRRRRAVPPLISVGTVTVDADVIGLWRRHVSHVKLEGLEIQIPPKDESDHHSSTAGGAQLIDGRQLTVDVLEAPGARLVILPKRTEKPPKTWELHQLRLESVSVNTTMPFKALLTNAVPPGQIATEGSLGPWQRDDPGDTPVQGRFTFEDADLGFFKGIDGTLSSVGSYGGSLGRIEVRGKTDTPDFMVKVSGQTVPLKTSYYAIVDGTNGDTRLEDVQASFLNTSLTAKGGVFDVKGVKGRLITLDVEIDRGRIEDVLRLAIASPRPSMTGALRLRTTFNLPPGDRDVIDKLRLNGHFMLERGRFTDAKTQQQIDGLSLRARGKPDVDTKRAVGSTFTGRFVLADGVLALPVVTFDVPGAVVELKGRYALRRETLAFAGELVMDAKLSETTTGFKSFLLKAVDPLFRREGKTVVPLRVTGTRDQPSFGLDMKRVFTRKDVAQRK